MLQILLSSAHPRWPAPHKERSECPREDGTLSRPPRGRCVGFPLLMGTSCQRKNTDTEGSRLCRDLHSSRRARPTGRRAPGLGSRRSAPALSLDVPGVQVGPALGPAGPTGAPAGLPALTPTCSLGTEHRLPLGTSSPGLLPNACPALEFFMGFYLVLTRLHDP